MADAVDSFLGLSTLLTSAFGVLRYECGGGGGALAVIVDPQSPDRCFHVNNELHFCACTGLVTNDVYCIRATLVPVSNMYAWLHNDVLRKTYIVLRIE